MKSFFVFCFLMIAGLGSQAHSPYLMASDKGPMMTFEKTTIHYGVIAKGSDPMRKFKFTNTGDSPLVIIDAQGSCGCTVPTFPKDAIEPGKTAVIEVRYDTNKVGAFNKQITIKSNIGADVLLHISGEVTEK
jgi:hypothetical protein